MSSATTSGAETMRLACDERADLAEFLATLTPEQWEAPTLCTLWRVRDVVAHIYSYEDLALIGFLRRFAAAGFNGDRSSARGVAAYADHSPQDLLARARHHLQPTGLTPFRRPDRAHRWTHPPPGHPPRTGHPPRGPRRAGAGGAAVRARGPTHRRRQTPARAHPRGDRSGLDHRQGPRRRGPG